jgi:predicted esterase
VLVWHGAGGSPSDATYILGDALQAIVDAGGIVAAPAHDPVNTQLPWFLDTGTRQDDLFVADEIVGCAHASVGFDTQRVHAVGFSAGALHTTQMSFRRASYVASVVTYSGGLINGRPPARDAADARFAAMILHGGESDVVIVGFQMTSESYLHAMQAAGDFGFICDHGMGHTVPPAARASAWAFLQAHPFGQLPRAYADGLPSDFYSFCALP